MMTFQVRLPAEKGMQTGVPVLDFLSSQALMHTCFKASACNTSHSMASVVKLLTTSTVASW